MGMFDDILTSISNMPTRDKVALSTSFIPVVGDITGAYADAVNIAEEYNKTGEIPWTDVGLALTGLLPFVPPAILSRSIKEPVKGMFEKGLKNTPNYLPGYYGGKVYSKPAGVAAGAVEGFGNLLKQAYSPKAQARYSEFGTSAKDISLAQQAVKKFEKSADQVLTDEAKKKLSDTGKKVMGQINYNRLLSDQYGNRETIYRALDGIDQIDFVDFSAKDYNKLMKAATGLENKSMDTVFRAISQIQNVKPEEVYRMAIRRPYTGQAGGNLRNLTGSEVFGGKSLGDLRNAFKSPDGKNKIFKTNKELVESLENQGIKIYNKEKVLKNNDIVLIQGSKKTDAYELGGVNYLTAVKKDGTMVTFVNDSNDLLGIPATRITKKMELNAPMAKKMISVSQPIHYDLLNRSRRSDAVSAALDNLNAESQRIRSEARTTNLPSLPNSGLNLPQSDFVRRLASLEPSTAQLIKGSARALGNFGLTGVRSTKPIERSMRDDTYQEIYE